jgi:cell division protein YceG involved in septum cleavage
MSMDDVITMASIIQMECQKVEEMRTVSAYTSTA